MVEIKEKQILIDGRPVLILSGELHYYRLQKKDWQDRIDKLKAAGCNTVASYVPWLCHEVREGHVDLNGKTREELDLCGFIDLCNENGLYFFLRPGPFIMAEMKNEGIPYWVYEKHPDIIPVTWDGKPVPTKTVDYLSPGFLEEVRKWYAEVMKITKPRLYQNGGNIIGIQLDNEVGMLSWVSNSPDLTHNVIRDFIRWLKTNYSKSQLLSRYSFDIDDLQVCRTAIRSPKEEFAAEFMHDLGYYMRNRFARYISTLRSYAEEFGVKDVPFIINIHGTSGGRCFSYPIGISQLYESYTQAPGYIPGSDIYIGDLTMNNFQDLYLINGFMSAVNRDEQPIASVEFECGDGNYGSTFGGRYDVSAGDFKTRMSIAQGNRMLNYYLLAGGYNYRLDLTLEDGNDRIAFTGERHGFAAPISPEGALNYTYPRLARSIRIMAASAEKLAVMYEEHDDVAFGFIPDYYMTEYRYPSSTVMGEILRNIESRRAHGAWEIMARAMLLAGYRFGAVDIQNKPLDPGKTPVLVLPSARNMDGKVQKKLADYINSGGGLLLYGELPQYDMEGEPCSLLADVLGVRISDMIIEKPYFYPSVYPDSHSWAAPRPEVRTDYAQVYECENAETLLKVYGSGQICGFDAKIGKGRAIVIGCSYACDIPLFRTALEILGARANLTHDCCWHGIFMTSTASRTNERFIHILNLDGFDKEFHVFEYGQLLFDGRSLHLQSKDGLMLPLNVNYNGIKIRYSTAEVLKVTDMPASAHVLIEFRLTQPEDIIVFEKGCEIRPSADYAVQEEGNALILLSCKHAKVDDRLSVIFVKPGG